MKVSKRVLLFLAGIVWTAAGFNVLRIGVLAYPPYLSILNFLLSLVVLHFFGSLSLESWSKNTQPESSVILTFRTFS